MPLLPNLRSERIEGSILDGVESISATTLTLASLAGAGTRMVVANSTGGTSTQAIPSGGTGTDTYVTGFTYNDSNQFLISDSTGGTFSATINTMTGLTVNGDLSASTLYSGSTNIETLFLNKNSFSGFSQITVSLIQPSSPSIGDLWVDLT
jgi:hypothetical protein